MLDRCSIASRSIEVTLLWTPLDSSFWQILILNTSQSIKNHGFLYKGSARSSLIFLRSLLIETHFSLFQTLQTQPLHIPHLIFSPNQVFFIWYDLISLLYHAFHSFWPKFWVFEKLKLQELIHYIYKFIHWVIPAKTVNNIVLFFKLVQLVFKFS